MHAESMMDFILAQTPDEEVVDRVRAGETRLYEILMKRHNHRIAGLARRILQNEADVEDLLQEAHFNAVHHIDQFEGRSSFLTWLTTITIREALACIRRRTRFVGLEAVSPGDGSGALLASTGPDPERVLLDAELRRAVAAAIAKLPNEYQAVFQLRAIEERDTAEVAELLQISETSVKTRLFRARSLLRRRLCRRLRSGVTLAADGQARSLRLRSREKIGPQHHLLTRAA